VGGKSEKSDRRRHGDDRDRTGTEGERRKKSDRHRDDERRDKKRDDTTESRDSKKVSCRCCFHCNYFIFAFTFIRVLDKFIGSRAFLWYCYFTVLLFC